MNVRGEEMMRAPLLRYYDPQKKTVPERDASSKGLGECLLQDGYPVLFASKS